MNAVGTKTIETERLILRKMQKKNAELIYKNWTSDENVSKYVTWDTHKSVKDTKKYVHYKLERYKNPYVFDWVVVLKETGEPIGEIDAVKVSTADRRVEMGDCFGSKFWNKGYATEALKAFIKYMFTEVEVDKVTACHMAVNPASGAVMKKAGMTYDATLKGYAYDKNTGLRDDLLYYSIDRR